MAFNQPDILPAAAEAMYRVLCAAPDGRLSTETLIQRVVPDGDGTGLKVFNMTLHELRAVGAIVEDGGRISVRQDGDRSDGMRTVLLQSLFEEASRPELWAWDDELELTGGLDLVRALAWLTLLPVAGPAWTWAGPSSAKREQKNHLAVAVIYNEERWRPFARWAGYLGFASTLRGSALIPDPTIAVKRVLVRHLGDGEFHPLREVAAVLGDSLPILDMGVVGLGMRARYPVRWESDLSPAVSLALTRLQSENLITFDESRGDAEKLGLADGQGAYNAIRWNREAA